MWKLLIVDDEAIIRESLKRFINWKSIDVTICGLASDGSRALDLILEDVPDIILSDISMPALNGIELIEFLRQHNIPSEVIFISAYSNFEYARAALKHGAFDYILKPLEEDLLLECVKKCIEKIKANNTNAHLIETLDQENAKKLHSLLLHCITDYNYTLTDSDLTVLHSNGFLSADFPYIGAIAVQNMHITNKDFSQLTASAPQLKHIILLEIETNIQIILMSSRDADAPTITAFQSVLDGLTNKNTETAARVHSRGFNRHHGSFRSLAAELFLSIIFNVTAFSTLLFRSEHLNFKFDLKTMTEIVKQGDAGKVEDLTYNLFLLFLRDGLVYDLDLLKLKCIEFIDNILLELSEYQLSVDLLPDSLTSKKNINAGRSLDKVFEITGNILKNLSSCFAHLRENSSSLLVRSATEYIHENYSKDISLNTVAKVLYVSPAYLSKIFKAEKGQTFSNYVLEHRIKIAKVYLKDPKYKIYQIAELCGFSDVPHFSKSFKQATNVSPNKYRNLG